MDTNEEIYEDSCGDHRMRCDGCRQLLSPEKLIDGHFCSHCIEHNANEGWLCEKCGRMFRFKELNKNRHCPDCRTDCQFCGASDVRIMRGACRDCRPENFDALVVCAVCHNERPARDMLFHNGWDVCPGCPDKPRICSRCSDTHPAKEMVWFNGCWYCQDCMETCRECNFPIPKDLPPAPGYCFNCLPF